MPLSLEYEKSLKIEFEKYWNSIGNLRRLFSFLLRELREEEEFLRTAELIASKPRKCALLLCDDAQMREFQKNFRNLNRTTDVLSFPTAETPEFAESSYLGDLIISLPAVQRNARRYRRSFERELYLVFTHGVLHLLGFEHVRVTPTRARRMKETQERLSKAFIQSIKNK